NGTVGPVHEVSTERVRLRLLNGSTARTYTFALPERPMTMVATGGGFLDAPLELDELRLAPGERAEVIARFRPGATVRPRAVRTDLGAIASAAPFGAKDEFDALGLRAGVFLAPSPGPGWGPSSQAQADALVEEEAVRTRYFALQGREINGREM